MKLADEVLGYALSLGFDSAATMPHATVQTVLTLDLKTEGGVQQRLGPWIWHTWGVFLVLYLLTTMATLMFVPLTRIAPEPTIAST